VVDVAQTDARAGVDAEWSAQLENIHVSSIKSSQVNSCSHNFFVRKQF
jgi:hypothetical protein